MHHRRYLAAALAIFLPAVAACAGNSTGAGGQALIPVTWRAEDVIGGHDLPEILGLDKGFFKDEGIDLHIEQGTGSSQTAEFVGAGTAQFGTADSATAILAIHTGVKIKMISLFGVTTKYIAVYSPHYTSPIKSLADLSGKSAGTLVGSSLAILTPFFIKEHHLNMKIISTSSQGALYGGIFNGKIQTVWGPSDFITDIQALKKSNPSLPNVPIATFDLSKYGLQQAGFPTIVNDAYAKSHPDIVRRFIKADQRSWQYVLASPAHLREAVQDAVRMFPAASAQQLAGNASIAVAPWKPYPGHPLGYFPPSLYALSLHVATGLLGKPITDPPSTFYTNQYLG